MKVFESRQDIREWLGNQSRDVCVVIAARAALRIAPNSGLTTSNQGEVSLAQFRALTAALYFVLSDKGIEKETFLPYIRAAASAAYDADYAATASTAATVAAEAVSNAADAAAYAADADADADDAADATDFAADSAAVAAAVAAGASFLERRKNFFKSISDDANFLESGRTIGDLQRQPLWLEQTELSEWFLNRWEDLSGSLISLNQDWEVWTDWYNDRLKGTPFNPKLEFGRISCPEEDYKDPAIINAKIKAMLEAHKASFKQDNSVEIYGITKEGEIYTASQDVGLALTDTPSQREWYEELVSAVKEAQEISSNNLGTAAKPLSRLSAVIPDNLSNARVPKLWPRMNNLRRVLDRHEKALSQPDNVFDKLETETADALQSIVETYNNLRIGDVALNEADKNAISPQNAGELRDNLEIIEPLISELISEGLVDNDAQESFEEILTVVNDDTDISLQNEIMGRSNVEHQADKSKNFILRLLKWQRDNSMVGAAKDVAVIVTLGEKIIKYAPEIYKFITKSMEHLKNIAGTILGM